MEIRIRTSYPLRRLMPTHLDYIDVNLGIGITKSVSDIEISDYFGQAN